MSRQFCILLVISALALCRIMILLTLKSRLAIRLKTASGIPSLGGIAMALSWLAASAAGAAMLGLYSRELAGILAGCLIILLCGLWDDLHEMSVAAKLLSQLAAVVVAMGLGIHTRIIGIGPAANAAITVLWLVGITNAFNHLDVIDGLAGTVALVSAAGFLLVSFIHYDPVCLVLLAACIGCIAPFLAFNLPPARIYMGNAGSHFLGFLLGSVAIVLKFATLDRLTAFVAPLLILGLPICDTAFLIWYRLSAGRSMVHKSDDHFVLRLISSGMSRRQSLLVTAVLSCTLCFSGVLVAVTGPAQGLAIILITVGLAGASYCLAGRITVRG
ncbi:MAG: MraY family glycosyltransferase [Deltaproteobacteria bacterium]